MILIERIDYLHIVSFKPYYKWITFNILLKAQMLYLL